MIYGSVRELNFYDFDKLKNGEFHRLEEDCLTFYSPKTEEFFRWSFNKDISNYSSLDEVVAFLDSKAINYFDITGRFDVELSFENFYSSKYKKIIEECKSIDLFHDTLNYVYFEKYCCIRFKTGELVRFKSFLIINNIEFRDFS